MKDLFVGRVGWRANGASGRRPGDILDMREHQGGAIGKALVLLAAAHVADMGRDPGVDDDVVVARILVDAEPSQDEEPPTQVQLPGLLAEAIVQSRQRESGLINRAPWQIARCKRRETSLLDMMHDD